jgi:hypothetical protein
MVIVYIIHTAAFYDVVYKVVITSNQLAELSNIHFATFYLIVYISYFKLLFNSFILDIFYLLLGYTVWIPSYKVAVT